jgi:hypothetical protein
MLNAGCGNRSVVFRSVRLSRLDEFYWLDRTEAVEAGHDPEATYKGEPWYRSQYQGKRMNGALQGLAQATASDFPCGRVVFGARYSGSRSPKWILNASRAVVQLRVRVYAGTALVMAR